MASVKPGVTHGELAVLKSAGLNNGLETQGRAAAAQSCAIKQSFS